MNNNKINSSSLVKGLLSPCIVFFLIGALMRIDIYIIGRFSAGELLAIAIFPFALSALPQLMSVRALKYLVYGLILWVIGVIVSDIANQSYFFLFLRGLARPLICLVLLVVVYYLGTRNPRSFLFFFYGLFVSGIFNAIIPTDFRAEDLEVQVLSNYKYAAFVLTPLVLGIASIGAYLIYRFSPFLAGGFQIGMALLSLPYFSRTTSAALLCSGLAICTFSMFPFLRGFFVDRGRLRAGSFTKAAVVVVLAFTAFYYVYAYAASSGWMGERQASKFFAQSDTVFGNTPWGVIMAGRHYTLAAMLRVMEHGILGAGSWPFAEDYIFRALSMLGMYNIPSTQMDPFVRDIGHSVVFGIWAQNGLLVLPFLLMAFFNTIKATIHILTFASPIKALVLIYFIIFNFGFFFNNFNSLTRFLIVFIPVFYVLYIQSGYMRGESSFLTRLGAFPPANRH